LVVVDGMPRDADNILPSEVEQITVLKGAAAVVLYGSRAAKGVILITTKRGVQGDLRISVRANSGIHVPKSYPKYLGSAEYMTLYNEARVNDGRPPLYDGSRPEYDIENYRSGINPYRFPDLDFYSSDYLKKVYNRSDAMAEITGGNEYAKFYTTMGYSREGSILKVGNANSDNNSRMFLRGNVDVKLHKLITANVGVNATFYDQTAAISDFWNGAANLRPNRVAPLVPLSFVDPKDERSWDMLNASSNIIGGKYFLGGTKENLTNPIADAYAAGIRKSVARQFQFNGGVNYSLQNVTDGLFFRGKYGVDYILQYSQAYNNEYATFLPAWIDTDMGASVIDSLERNGRDLRNGVQTISNTAYQLTTFFSGQFDYTKALSGGHNIFAMLLANGWLRQNDGEYQSIQSVNLGLQLSYNFREKYYADFSAAVPYSTKMSKGNRSIFSPTGTLGWRLTNEDFMSSQTVFDDLMLTVSGGVVYSDLDITTDDNQRGYFLYRSIVQPQDWWTWGDGHGQATMAFVRGANPNLGFVKRKDLNVGFRGSLLDKLITFDANYFNVRMDGMLSRVSSIYPVYFQQTYPSSDMLPYLNYNIDDRQGVDFNVNFNKQISEVSLSLGVNGIFQTDNVVKRDENYEFDYQTRMGRPLNQIWGLQSCGLFESQKEIDTPGMPQQTFGEVKPGDISYFDQNGDGKIDSNDEVYLGSWNSNTVLGLNFTAKWKKFTFFAVGTGYFGGHGLKNDWNNETNANDLNYYWSGRSDRKYSEVVRGRWTEDTKDIATYPRLTTTNGDNSFRNSDFWLYKTDRFDLRMVQLTYDVPVRAGALKDLSVYLGGYNLLTLSKERKHMEMSVGSAPNTRFYNLGVKATF